ncbi:transposase-like protein [Oxalobacteraceae bacterium GrIS 1.18]
MKPTPFKKFIDSFNSLSASECIETKKALIRREQLVQGSLLLREAEAAMKECPHCGNEHFIKNGLKDNRQRFKCKACFASFNALTGTPLTRLRKPEMHLQNAACMVDGLSIKKTAARLCIATTTAFRWRHRFLRSPKLIQPLILTGVVEADETFFIESFKGQRKDIPRPSKARGTKAKKRGLSKEQIPVLVARDRSSGATLSAVVASRTAKDIGEKLSPVLSDDCLLCTDGAHAYRVIAKNKGIQSKSVPAKKSSGSYHIQNVNSYHSRLKGWMHRFY